MRMISGLVVIQDRLKTLVRMKINFPKEQCILKLHQSYLKSYMATGLPSTRSQSNQIIV